MGWNAQRYAPALTSVVVMVGLLLSLFVAMKSVLAAAAVAIVLVGVIMIGWLGLEKTSIVLMVLAFALAPDDRLGVSFLGISDVLFFASMGLAFPRLLKTPVTLPLTFILAAVAFSTFGVLSNATTNDPNVYYYTARVIFMLVVLPIMVVWWAPSGRVLVALLVAFVVGTCISIAYGLPKIGAYRNYGLTQHPNILGYTATLTMALLPFLFLALSPKWRYWFCGVALGGVAVGVATSGSRAALVVAVVLILLVPAVERSIPLALTVAIAGVAAVGFIGQRAAPAEGQDALSRLLGAGDASNSDQARVEGVAKTWQIALHHPWLGTGFNLPEFLGHDVYVQVAAAVGFLGLATFLVLLASMVTPLFATDNINSRLVYPAIVFIVAGPVSPQLTDRYIGILLGIALIGVNSVRAQRQAEAEVEAESEARELTPSRLLLRLNK